MKRRFVLRDLPFSARVTLAVFLLAVGLGYCSAMVQLHMQHASAGQLLPTPDDAVKIFHGSSGPAISKFQRLLEADESLPMNGSGSMASAFTKRSGEWQSTIKKLAAEMKVEAATAEIALRRERDGERKAVLAWVTSKDARAAYDADRFDFAADQPITAQYREGDAVKIKTILVDRCVRCHAKEGDDEKASGFPLSTYDEIQKYTKVEASGDRMSLDKLAQSSHVHLLGFAVLFGFTGLLFALTSYPGPLRLVLAPLVLLAQVADIGCWWLARIDGTQGEMFAKVIPITGAIVGAGLGLQIVLTLLHLFGALGRLVLIGLFAAAGYGGYVANDKVVQPFLKAKANVVEVKQKN